MNLLFFFKYIKYFLFSINEFNIHSPFVYDFYIEILGKKNECKYLFIEDLRKELMNSKLQIICEDYGAGSKSKKTKNIRYVSEIASNSLKSTKYAMLLARIVNYYKPLNIIELGTSLGITTCYLAQPNNNANIITIEGSVDIADMALKNFKRLNLKNIQQISGNFNEILPEILSKTSHIDFVFFDGNHRKEPTLNYFYQCLTKVQNHTIFVFDDVHWSDEMEEAWKIIKNNPQVSVTIDLFFMGIVFFRKELTKQNFIIRF